MWQCVCNSWFLKMFELHAKGKFETKTFEGRVENMDIWLMRFYIWTCLCVVELIKCPTRESCLYMGAVSLSGPQVHPALRSVFANRPILFIFGRYTVGLGNFSETWCGDISTSLRDRITKNVFWHGGPWKVRKFGNLPYWFLT